MNYNPKISVVVPIYNVEKYLSQCIDSILNQDFTDFELLLIDDGSRDQSGQICDAYARLDRRVRVFHKENGGVSSARNLGIDYAQGKYIVFIDSDDYVDIDYFSILTETPVDFVATGYVQFDEENGHITRQHLFDKAIYTMGQFKDCLPSILDGDHMTTPWAKLFRAEIIKKNKIHFDPKIRFAEDTIFIQQYLLYCETICFQDRMPYHFRNGTNDNAFFRYNLSSDEYIYTMQMELRTYNQIVEKFNMPDNRSNNITIKDIFVEYYRNISKSRFTLKGFSNYKRTMKIICPDVSLGDRLYAISYKLVCRQLYFLSFLILRFVYPFKLRLKHISYI